MFVLWGVVAAVLVGLLSCSEQEATTPEPQTPQKAPAIQVEYDSVEELNGKRAAIWTGTVGDPMTRKCFPDSPGWQYTKVSDMMLALQNGKVDFFVMEEPQARFLQAQQPATCIMPNSLLVGWDYALAFSFEKRELCEAFSAEIRRLMQDGTVEKLKEKWFSIDESIKTMPVRKPGSKGTLRIGTVPEVEPFTYIKNGEYVGLDLELATAIAEKLGYSTEFVMLDFGSFIEALQAGKIDLMASCITVTEERKEKLLFADSHYAGGCVVMVRNIAAQNNAAAGGSWLQETWSSLCTSFDRTFVRENRWKLVLEGLYVTIIITLISAVIGTILAFPVWLARTSASRVLRSCSTAYISLMQGTPIVVILMILYYVVFAKVDINSILVASIGFGLNMSAYVGEMLRTGIDGVPKGQREASLALGFTRLQTFRKVVLPQALRQILPVYRGEFINLLKTTSIVGYIAIQDLTKMSDIIRSRTYEAFFPLLATAVIYFLTAMLLASLLSYLEYRLNPKNRRNQG